MQNEVKIYRQKKWKMCWKHLKEQKRKKNNKLITYGKINLDEFIRAIKLTYSERPITFVAPVVVKKGIKWFAVFHVEVKMAFLVLLSNNFG